MSHDLTARVTSALGRIINPRFDNDLLSAGMVRDLEVKENGRVRFTFLLAKEDQGTLVRDARRAVQAVDHDGDVAEPAHAKADVGYRIHV